MLVEKNTNKTEPGIFTEGQVVRTPMGVGTIKRFDHSSGKWIVETDTGGNVPFLPTQITPTSILKG